MVEQEIRVKIVLECLEDELKKAADAGDPPRLISVNKLNNRIEYNTEAKAYDFIYGVTASDFETSDVLKILDSYCVAYNYQGKDKNKSKRFLFEGYN